MDNGYLKQGDEITFNIRCCKKIHKISYCVGDSAITLHDHTPEEEQLMRALKGSSVKCLGIKDAWMDPKLNNNLQYPAPGLLLHASSGQDIRVSPNSVINRGLRGSNVDKTNLQGRVLLSIEEGNLDRDSLGRYWKKTNFSLCQECATILGKVYKVKVLSDSPNESSFYYTPVFPIINGYYSINVYSRISRSTIHFHPWGAWYRFSLSSVGIPKINDREGKSIYSNTVKSVCKFYKDEAVFGTPDLVRVENFALPGEYFSWEER